MEEVQLDLLKAFHLADLELENDIAREKADERAREERELAKKRMLSISLNRMQYLGHNRTAGFK